MADKFEPYIKDADGTLLPVVAVYDADGNVITDSYLKKTEAGAIRIFYDADGYPCYEDRT